MSEENNTVILKKCSKCTNEKPLDQFRKCARNRDGLSGFCRSCHSAASKENYEKNKKKRIFRVRLWQTANPDKVTNYVKTFKEKNKIDESNNTNAGV